MLKYWAGIVKETVLVYPKPWFTINVTHPSGLLLWQEMEKTASGLPLWTSEWEYKLNKYMNIKYSSADVFITIEWSGPNFINKVQINIYLFSVVTLILNVFLGTKNLATIYLATLKSLCQLAEPHSFRKPEEWRARLASRRLGKWQRSLSS